MSSVTGWVTLPASTGTWTISSLPFTPNKVYVIAGGKSSGSTTANRNSQGHFDGTNSRGTAGYSSSADHFTRNYPSDCIAILSTPGGVQDEIAQGAGSSFSTNQCTFNLSVTDNQYEVCLTFED